MSVSRYDPWYNIITYNIDGLTAAEQNLARLALADWARIANLTFVQVHGTADISYNHNGSGTAATSQTVSGTSLTSATVDISSNWNGGDDSLNSYMMQTYIHETGHALGLGHQGPYNNSATYGVDNIYTDDTWQWSVMSYFNQTNYAGNNPRATYDFVVTPEMADINAIQRMYGAAASTGGLTYGFHSNAGTPFDFSQDLLNGTAPAFTIYNTANNNTLDASGFSTNDVLNATPGAWSSVGGEIDNIGIDPNTHINNLVAGSGNDTLIPNPSLTGTLTGGSGLDTFQSSMFGLSEYTIAGVHNDDKLYFTDGNLPTFAYQWTSGTALQYNGSDSLFFASDPVGHLVKRADPSGGVDLTLRPAATGMSDFTDVGTSGVLFYDSSNTDVGAYEIAGGIASWHDFGTSSASYQPLGTGDFNGDGDSDILWRDNTNGDVGYYSIVNNKPTWKDLGLSSSAYNVVGIGDFNDDHVSDILFRDPSNTDLGYYRVSPNGSVTWEDMGLTPASYQVEGVGDFTGNGTSDVLWENPTTGDMGDYQLTGANSYAWHDFGLASTAYGAVGVGDFTGNGKSDILFRDDATSDLGYFAINNNVSTRHDLGPTNPKYNVAGIGDYNGDGVSDILWRNNANGDVGYYQMASGGGSYTWHDLGLSSTAYHVVVQAPQV